jgi:hypothetical protein
LQAWNAVAWKYVREVEEKLRELTELMSTLTRTMGPPYLPETVMSMAAQSVTEGDSGTKTMTFTVQVSPPQLFSIMFSYETVDITATAGQDYVAVAGSKVILAGQTSTTIPVTILADTAFESDETFTLRLFNIGWLPV